MNEIKRCEWAKGELDIKYHDEEWGKAEFDDAKLFEIFILETMQAGLSWSTILRKRENMRKAFDKFDYTIIAKYNDEKKKSLLEDEGIIRNRLKIDALISNAKAFMKIQEEYGSFSKYIWKFTNDKPIVNKWENISEVPAKTEMSDKMSKELKKKGFKFAGSTICYAFMQATGMVNDHMVWCSEYKKSLKVKKS